MTKLILTSLLIIIALLYIATPKLTIRPFSLSFTNGWFALGFMFVMLGIGLIRYQGYTDGRKEGIDTAFKFVKQVLKKEKV